MGEKALEIFTLTIQAFKEENLDAAQQALKLDNQLDQLEIIIDQKSVSYVSLNSPVATDARLITLLMKSCQDLERIGDESCSIARRIWHSIQKDIKLPKAPIIIEMINAVSNQLQTALDSIHQNSLEKARDVLEADEQIDRLYKQSFRVFLNPDYQKLVETSQIVDLLFIAKSLERIGDHAVNLAEEVIYFLEAVDIRHQSPDHLNPKL